MSDSGLWRFAVSFYRQPAVAGACLQLQDEAGADVNVMLCLLFLAAHGRPVDADEVTRIEELVAVWRNTVVAPLREIRRKLKQPLGAFEVAVTAELRNDVKRVELAAERIQLEALERFVAVDSAPAAAVDRRVIARDNLAAYAGNIGPLPDQPVRCILDAFAQFTGR